jgi:hypothetical protein
MLHSSCRLLKLCSYSRNTRQGEPPRRLEKSGGEVNRPAQGRNNATLCRLPELPLLLGFAVAQQNHQLVELDA